jgi:tetratricopeptide (TPR) repeat protein
LEKLAALDGDALEANLRLIEICEASEDWQAVAKSAEQALAVNPLIRAPHRSLARAAEAIDDPRRAIHAYRALLRMDPVDPAEAHFRLARLLFGEGDLASARREVLKALEEAPRFRAAHRLLLEIVARAESQAAASGPDEQTAEQEP